MAIDPKKVQQELRLAAIEYMLTRLYLIVYRTSGITQSQIDAANEEFLSGIANHVFPVDGQPALSDYGAAEWEAAIRRLVEMQKSMGALLKGP